MTRFVITVNLDIGGRRPAAEIFDAAGLAWEHRYGGPAWNDDTTRAAVAEADGILAGAERFDAATLANAGRLRVIARNGVGYDRVDLEECTRRGIVVTYTPGVMADAVADLTFALLLAVVRSLPAGDHGVKEGGYEAPIGEDLASLTMGLLGCGRIGARTVRRARGFGMRTLVHDPFVDAAALSDLEVEAVDRDRLLAESDVISLHLPLSPSTAGIVDAAFLQAMKPGSILVNTARGGLVDEPALLDALRSGHLSGAGLDCQGSEPPVGVSREIVALPDVVAMPHVGSKTVTARVRMAEMAARSMVDVVQGRAPEHVVNREVLERLYLK